MHNTGREVEELNSYPPNNLRQNIDTPSQENVQFLKRLDPHELWC